MNHRHRVDILVVPAQGLVDELFDAFVEGIRFAFVEIFIVMFFFVLVVVRSFSVQSKVFRRQRLRRFND